MKKVITRITASPGYLLSAWRNACDAWPDSDAGAGWLCT